MRRLLFALPLKQGASECARPLGSARPEAVERLRAGGALR